jgi:hypothetical protein
MENIGGGKFIINSAILVRNRGQPISIFETNHFPFHKKIIFNETFLGEKARFPLTLSDYINDFSSNDDYCKVRLVLTQHVLLRG